MYKNIIIILFLLFTSIVDAGINIGSDSSVDRFNEVQVLNDGDRIAGFAAIEGGFKLFDSTTTGTFDSFFAASGEIGLRGGTLILFKDLIIRDVGELQTLGNVIGGGHVIELDFQDKFIPSRLGCDVEIFGTTFVSVSGLTNDWRFDSNFFAAELDSPAVNIPVIFSGSTLALVTFLSLPAPVSTGTSLRWHPFRSLLAATRLQTGGSDELFVLDFTEPASLTSVSSDSIDAGDYNACAWHPSGNFLAVGGSESASQIKIYPVDSSGFLDFAGTLTVAISPDRAVQREAMDWDITGSFLAVGVEHISGNDPDLLVYQFSPEPFLDLTLNATALVETGTAVLAVDWNPVFQSQIGIGIDGGFSESVQLYQHDDGGGGSLAGSLVNRGGISDLSSVAVQDVDWKNNGTCLAVGRAIAAGSGAFRVYNFDEDIPRFDLINSVPLTGAGVPSTRWAPNGQFASSMLDTAFLVIVYQSMVDATSFIWSDVIILLGHDVIVRECAITFTGECVINGRGNSLTFQSDCQFLVGSNSTLRFKDITLKGVTGSIFQGVDDTATFTFDNVHLILDTDYTFSQGYFDVINKLVIEGENHTFNYQTDLISTITGNASLILEEGVTFNYAPPVASKTLLVLADDSSSIHLESATLSTTSTGIQLTKGNLFVDGRSFLSNTGTILAEGIVFGDGAHLENNLNVEWLPGARLEHTQGFFRDANV